MKTRIATLVVFSLISVGINSTTEASAGLFDCVKAKKWASAKSLRSAYLLDPELKTPTDWFNGYIFARIYTGYPGCFNKSDVNVMRQYVQYINSYCVKNPSWNNLCAISKGTGKLADWVYSNYR